MPVPFPVFLKLIYRFFSHQKAVNDIPRLFALHQDLPVLYSFLILVVIFMLWVLTQFISHRLAGENLKGSTVTARACLMGANSIDACGL